MWLLSGLSALLLLLSGPRFGVSGPAGASLLLLLLLLLLLSRLA
jgi:hypothetical protein